MGDLTGSLNFLFTTHSQDLGLEGSLLTDILYRDVAFLNLVDPISHDLLVNLARDLQCPKKVRLAGMGAGLGTVVDRGQQSPGLRAGKLGPSVACCVALGKSQSLSETCCQDQYIRLATSYSKRELCFAGPSESWADPFSVWQHCAPGLGTQAGETSWAEVIWGPCGTQTVLRNPLTEPNPQPLSSWARREPPLARAPFCPPVSILYRHPWGQVLTASTHNSWGHKQGPPHCWGGVCHLQPLPHGCPTLTAPADVLP